MTTRRALLDALHAHLGPEYVCAENVPLGGPDGITVDMVAIDKDGESCAVSVIESDADIDRLDWIWTTGTGRMVPVNYWWALTTPALPVADCLYPQIGVMVRQSNRIIIGREAHRDLAPSWDDTDVAAFTRAAVVTARNRAGWARHLPAYEADWLQAHPHGQVIGRASITETAHLRPGQRVPDGWALLGVGGRE